ncbi:hypothetical protein H6G64_04185 [Calothrix sp. FACHB-156]|nr:hypothetical protein [Calothrix sp. FACHB-156]
MKLKTTIFTMVGCLMVSLTLIHQHLLASNPTRVSQAASSYKLTNIPNTVSLKIRQDMAKRLNLKLADVQIVKVDAKIFDSCLNLPASNENCQKIGLKGWALTVVGGKQRWLYHAVAPQSLRNNFRVNWLQSLPKNISANAITNSTLLSEPPIGKLRVTSVEPRVWKNNCLELSRTDQRCNSTNTPGWLITLKNAQPNPKEPAQWIYRSDLNGQILKLDLIASVGNLSQKTIAEILSDAANRSQIQPSAWKVDQIQTLQWSSYGGDGPSRQITGAVPVRDNVFGWKVLVSSPKQQWVYYATKMGFEFDAPKSVPRYLVNEAIKAASVQTGKPANTFNLHWADQVTWNDTCLGVTINKPACQKMSIPGWRITLMGQGDTSSVLFSFHSRLDQDVRFNGSSPWLPPPVANPGS